MEQRDFVQSNSIFYDGGNFIENYIVEWNY